jgi:nitrogen fixation-related uncharacterized protein
MRNRLLKLLFVIPIAIVLFIVGWTMSWAGESKEQKRRKTRITTDSKDDFVTVMPAIFEEDLETAS